MPTKCAPAMPWVLPSCAAVGPVIKKARPIPITATMVPARIARERAGSPRSVRNNCTAVTRANIHTITIMNAITDHSVVASGADTVKWPVVPAPAAPTMMTISLARAMVDTVPIHQASRRRLAPSRQCWSERSSQARVIA